MKNFKPKGNNVLIELIPRKKESDFKKTKSGLLMVGNEEQSYSGTYSHKDYVFRVLDIGPDVADINIGDNVMFSGHYANSVKDDDDQLFVLVSEEYIYATYED